MKKSRVPNLVILAIMTVVTIFVWIIFSVFRIFTTKPTSTVPPEILAPLSPNLDREIIDKIQGREFIPGAELTPTIIIPTLPPAGTETFQIPSVSPTPTTSPTGQLPEFPSFEATESGGQAI